MTRIQRLGGIALVGLLAAIVAFTLLNGTSAPNPEFRGRRISTWFDQLCSGMFSGSPAGDRFPEAYDAFTQMGPEVVPYLAWQLGNDRSQMKESVLLWLKQQRITGPLMQYAILPSSRRTYAAVALRRMGASAETAVPALLKAWKNDIPEVKINCVSAMAAILHAGRPGSETVDGLGAAKYREFERKVVLEAAERFPAMANALQISFPAKGQQAEANGGTNGIQPAGLRKTP